MQKSLLLTTLMLFLIAAAVAQSNSAQSNPGQSAPSSTAPGATAQGTNAQTAGQQGSTTQSTTALPSNREKLGGTDPTQRISREVLHQMLMNPYYSVFDNLAYSVQGDAVTLLGQVVNPATKSDAAAAVKRIEGVERVNDQIEVLPPNPQDDRIRHEEYRTIYSYDGLSRYSWGTVPSIHIVVKNGHVTLVGAVDSQADKQLAGQRANGVPGVFSVDNQLQVTGGK